MHLIDEVPAEAAKTEHLLTRSI
jgi:hypothetical protein